MILSAYIKIVLCNKNIIDLYLCLAEHVVPGKIMNESIYISLCEAFSRGLDTWLDKYKDERQKEA